MKGGPQLHQNFPQTPHTHPAAMPAPFYADPWQPVYDLLVQLTGKPFVSAKCISENQKLNVLADCFGEAGEIRPPRLGIGCPLPPASGDLLTADCQSSTLDFACPAPTGCGGLTRAVGAILRIERENTISACLCHWRWGQEQAEETVQRKRARAIDFRKTDRTLNQALTGAGVRSANIRHAPPRTHPMVLIMGAERLLCWRVCRTCPGQYKPLALPFHMGLVTGRRNEVLNAPALRMHSTWAYSPNCDGNPANGLNMRRNRKSRKKSVEQVDVRGLRPNRSRKCAEPTHARVPVPVQVPQMRSLPPAMQRLRS